MVIKLILYLFEGMSGLSINFSKMCLYSTQMNQLPDVALAQALNYSTILLPLTYLDVPILGRRPRQED